MIIQVTQQNIDSGQRLAACSCPVALAILRDLPQYGVGVSSTGITLVRLPIEAKHPHTTLVTPRDVIAFVKAFDRGADVSPFKFELVVPDES